MLVWRYIGGTEHRLQLTSGDSEDTGAAEGASIADAFHGGPDLNNLTEAASGHELELAVYTEVFTRAPFVAEDIIEVPLSWLHIPDGAEHGDQFRALFVTRRGRLPTSADIEDYNDFVQWEAAQRYNDPVIRSAASGFKAVACTAGVDARTNTEIADAIGGAPVHWLDGGWDHHPTLVANFGRRLLRRQLGQYRLRRLRHGELQDVMEELQGLDRVRRLRRPASVSPHGKLGHGPHGRRGHTERFGCQQRSPGRGRCLSGYAYHKYYVTINGERQERLLPLYAISPIFTVIDDGSDRTIWQTAMTVATSTNFLGLVIDKFAGFGSGFGGTLGSTQFTYEGTAYSVSGVFTQKQDLGRRSHHRLITTRNVIAAAG